MRDRDVRAAMLERLKLECDGDHNTRIVEEMGIWSGSVRIDLAVINGELSGYELKSDRDTLERLPTQAQLYSRVFDRVCLVVGSKHAKKARRIVPRWWGVIVATDSKNGVSLELARESDTNRTPDPILIARLLWREEALAILDDRNLATGWRSKSAALIHERLSSVLPLAVLSDCVRTALKKRDGWLGQAGGNQRDVSVHANFDPSLATPRGGLTANA
jgi:hypothetical protein